MLGSFFIEILFDVKVVNLACNLHRGVTGVKAGNSADSADTIAYVFPGLLDTNAERSD